MQKSAGIVTAIPSRSTGARLSGSLARHRTAADETGRAWLPPAVPLAWSTLEGNETVCLLRIALSGIPGQNRVRKDGPTAFNDGVVQAARN